MEEYLNNPYIRIALAIIATSALLSILNLFRAIRDGDKWYHDNRVLVLIMAFVFTLSLNDWTKFGGWADVPFLFFKLCFVSMFCFLVAVSKGQEIVDKVVGAVANKITKKADENIQP